MKLMKKTFLSWIALATFILILGVAPTQKVHAASYPDAFMYEDSEFEKLCVTRTMECSSNTQLYFERFRAYNYEKYVIEIYDSNDKMVASTEGTPPASAIGHITINWDTSDYSAGDYEILVHKKFYSFYTWNESPNPSRYWITLTRPHTHTWDSGSITTEPTVFTEGVKTIKCTSCNETTIKSVAKLIPTIKLSATKKTLQKGKSFKLSVSNLAKGDSIKSVKSSNKKIATVKKNGKKCTITAKKKGKATISVILKSGKKATCKITVK